MPGWSRSRPAIIVPFGILNEQWWQQFDCIVLQTLQLKQLKVKFRKVDKNKTPAQIQECTTPTCGSYCAQDMVVSNQMAITWLFCCFLLYFAIFLIGSESKNGAIWLKPTKKTVYKSPYCFVDAPVRKEVENTIQNLMDASKLDGSWKCNTWNPMDVENAMEVENAMDVVVETSVFFRQ